jgi:hypothetical protein
MPTGPTHRLSFAVCKTAHITVIVVIIVVVVVVVAPPPPPTAAATSTFSTTGADLNLPGVVNTNGCLGALLAVASSL